MYSSGTELIQTESRIFHRGYPLSFSAQARTSEQIDAGSRNRGTGEPLTIGYVGRVTPQKGVHILVEGRVGTWYSCTGRAACSVLAAK